MPVPASMRVSPMIQNPATLELDGPSQDARIALALDEFLTLPFSAAERVPLTCTAQEVAKRLAAAIRLRFFWPFLSLFLF